MNTLFFKYALEVERTRSITQAADNLFMAQPNLSKSIKEMEDTLGFHVFERTSKGVIPTEKGHLFLEYARSVVAQLDKIDALADSADENIQKFSISIPRGSYISKGITRFVSELDQTMGIDLNIYETNSMQAINNLVDGKFNLAIIRYQVVYEPYFKSFLQEKRLSADTVWEFEHLVLMSRYHKLAAQSPLKLDDLGHSIEIVHGDNVVPYLSAEKNNKDPRAAAPKKRIYLYERGNQFELLSNIHDTFMWVSPIPRDMLEKYGLIQRKCVFQGNKYKDMLVYPKSYRFSELDKKFIDKLYEAKKEVALAEYL